MLLVLKITLATTLSQNSQREAEQT